MQVTLHGGPHDGRRVTIGPAVAERRILFVNDIHDLPLPEPGEEFPTAINPPVSIYRAQLWADGPLTGPKARSARTWLKWTYTGKQ